MAAKDVAQRPLNLTLNGGQALASSDAAHVTVATTPSDVAAAAALGASFDAARTDHAHRGAFTVKKLAGADIFGTITLSEGLAIDLTQAGNDISVASEKSPKICLDDHWPQSNVDAGAEFVIMEWDTNFSDLITSANIIIRLSTIIRAGGGTTTVRLRQGGTLATADGTVRCTLTTGSAVDVPASIQSASFANPGGEQLIKITLQSSAPGNTNNIRGTSVVIG